MFSGGSSLCFEYARLYKERDVTHRLVACSSNVESSDPPILGWGGVVPEEDSDVAISHEQPE